MVNFGISGPPHLLNAGGGEGGERMLDVDINCLIFMCGLFRTLGLESLQFLDSLGFVLQPPQLRSDRVSTVPSRRIPTLIHAHVSFRLLKTMPYSYAHGC